MRVGVIGGGIVGSAIAATIKKYHPAAKVTIIDDKRPFQTSQAGQGYLWSIHRCVNDDIADISGTMSSLECSLEAKEAWIQLLGNDSANMLFEERGSLLVAPSSSREKLLTYYDVARDLLGNKVSYLADVSTCNKVVLPSVCGIQYGGNDYTCSPPALIRALMEIYDINFECRTVDNLKKERKRFDCVVCSTGPWLNELNDVGIEPVRGVLMQLSPGSRVSKIDIDRNIPMMEFGYGSLGVHFTLSSRGGDWLLGASREEVSFSIDGVDEVMENLIKRSNEFLHEDTFGHMHSSKIGFRPAYVPKEPSANKGKWPFQIKHEDGVVFCYGFEGQGVLYAAFAAEKVLNELNLLQR